MKQEPPKVTIGMTLPDINGHYGVALVISGLATALAAEGFVQCLREFVESEFDIGRAYEVPEGTYELVKKGALDA